MGPAEPQGQSWVRILLSASLLTVWTLPATALDANPRNSTTKALATPTITITPAQAVEQKDQVTCQCITAETNVTVQWVFNNRLLVPHERMQLSEDGKTLSILVVERADEGTYQCEIQDAANQSQRSNTGSLTIYYGPDPIEIQVDTGELRGNVTEVTEGSTLTFSVLTQSNPQPTYQWYLPSGHIRPDHSDTYTLTNVSLENSGTYRCLVNNNSTQLSRLGALQIRVLERLTKPLIIPPNAYLVEGASFVQLQCQTSHLEAGVRWYIGGQLLQPNGRLQLLNGNLTLSIQHLLRNDKGPYECEVWGTSSQERSDALSLVIFYGPNRAEISRDLEPWLPTGSIWVPLNASLTLHCGADEAFPEPSYRWTSEQASWEHLGQQLVIPAVTAADQGVYNCTVNNINAGRTVRALVRIGLVDPHGSVLSTGAIAGIVIGILTILGLVAALYRYRSTRKAQKSSASRDVGPSASVEGRPSQSSFGHNNSVYADTGDPPKQTRFTEDPTPNISEQFYTMKPPSSETFVDHPQPPRRPLPKPVLTALNPTPRQGKAEHHYEKETPFSEALGSHPHPPWGSLPEVGLTAPDTTPQKENTEHEYEFLVNPSNDIYEKINPEA